MRGSVVILAGAALACAAAVVVILNLPATKQRPSTAAKAAPEPELTAGPNNAAPDSPPEEAPHAVGASQAPMPSELPKQDVPLPAESVRANRQAPRASPQTAGGSQSRGPLQDPVAREALALVGVDPLAEEYWFAAINDPSLSAHERQDLIEDLNEDGLPDPKHPTPADLPVILNRLWIIEAAGPDAMDQVNADAFHEAYKDLVNLADLALGGGQPVR